MEIVVNSLTIVLSTILLILIIVGIHEMGHYLAARFFSIHVIRFKIGFGKTLLKFINRNGCEFSIGLIPLGGYVQMLGENESVGVDIYQEKSNLESESKSISYMQASLGQRAIVTAAGPFANFVLAIFVYFIISLIGVNQLAPIVGNIEKDSYAQEIGLNSGDRIVSVDDRSIKSFNDINLALVSRIGDSGKIKFSFEDQESGSYSIKEVLIDDWLKDSDQSNPLLSFGISPFIPPIISSLDPSGPAFKAGFKEGDVVSEIDEQTIYTWTDLADYISKRPNTYLTFKVLSGGQEKTLELVSSYSVLDDGSEIGRIGIARVSRFEDFPSELTVFNRLGPFEAIYDAIIQTYKYSILIIESIGKMISGKVSTDNLGGPIQISVLAGSAAKSGIISFLSIIALLSINLGLINLLPIPILDGGQLTMIAIEKIKGSPISESFLEYSARIGIFFILCLMFFAIFNDILRIF
tara:strand:- start:125847 stop:127244 length:1398 start_codon:yes stop_codon:yes gene_type:complete